MRVIIRDSNEKMNKLDCVEKILYVSENLTLCKELKDSLIVVHRQNHCEKYRLYKGGTILSVEED